MSDDDYTKKSPAELEQAIESLALVQKRFDDLDRLLVRAGNPARSAHARTETVREARAAAELLRDAYVQEMQVVADRCAAELRRRASSQGDAE